MRQVQRSAVVPFPAESMFDLVADVESYPGFLPGCTGASVRSRDANTVVGSVSFAMGPLHLEFTTRNELVRPERISMRLEDGPFRELQGAWSFQALGEAGCKVSLDIRFGFDNRLADLAVGLPFEGFCSQLVDAFVRRAKVLYG